MSVPTPTPLRILHDWLQVRGGAERVSLWLAEALQAELCVHAADPAVPDHMPCDRAGRPLLQALVPRPPARHPVTRALAAWWAFERLAPSTVPVALFSGHYAPLAWRAHRDARRVLYLHGPPLPFVHDPDDPGLGQLAPWARSVARPALRLLARRHAAAVQAMHAVVANSRVVAERFEQRFQRPAVVIPPPVDPRFFACGRASEGYWISTARHEPMKRVERVVEAFLGLPEQRLVVAGHGSRTPHLQRMAAGAPNIRFVGALPTGALADWLGGAIGSVHIARDEPFGLAVAESLAAGKPVLASPEGGVAELVRPGIDGLWLPPDPDVDALRQAVRGAPATLWSDALQAQRREGVAHLQPARVLAALRAQLWPGDAPPAA